LSRRLELSAACRVAVVLSSHALLHHFPVYSMEIAMTAAEQAQPRLLTEGELAVAVKFFRECRQWSQEQLAETPSVSSSSMCRCRSW
jgi:hypothetical protein